MSFLPSEGHSSQNYRHLPTTPYQSAGQPSLWTYINIPQALHRVWTRCGSTPAPTLCSRWQFGRRGRASISSFRRACHPPLPSRPWRRGCRRPACPPFWLPKAARRSGRGQRRRRHRRREAPPPQQAAEAGGMPPGVRGTPRRPRRWQRGAPPRQTVGTGARATGRAAPAVARRPAARAAAARRGSACRASAAAPPPSAAATATRRSRSKPPPRPSPAAARVATQRGGGDGRVAVVGGAPAPRRPWPPRVGDPLGWGQR